VIIGTHLGMKYMKKGGTIVNIASILGIDPFPGCPIYVGTKYAVVGMTRSWGVSVLMLIYIYLM
jgi:short-subunit dehydrogenase